jgi:hypothetical protein
MSGDGLILGGVVLGILVVALIASLWYTCCYKKREYVEL